MAVDGDDELLRAAIHDAHLLCQGGDEIDDRDLGVVKELLGLAEVLVEGVASDADRRRVCDLVHPSTRSHYLSR